MEKLANHIALQSITEGGMEKKALNFGQLVRMKHVFANRGKSDRFKHLMDLRASKITPALQNSRRAVHNTMTDAINTVANSGQRVPIQLLKNRARHGRKLINNEIPPQFIDDHYKFLAGDLGRRGTNPEDIIDLVGHGTSPFNYNQLDRLERVIKVVPQHHAALVSRGFV